MVFHNLTSSETSPAKTSVELPNNFTSPQALALSSQGILLLAGLSNQSTYRLAWCHLPTSTQFSFIDFPSMPIPLDPRHVYAHVYHPNKLAPSSFSVILVVALRGIHEPRYKPGRPSGRGSLFIYSSGAWTWSYKLFQKCTPVLAAGSYVSELWTLPMLIISRPFLTRNAQGVQCPGDPFMFVYFMCESSEDSSAGFVCCMRLETAKGEWEVMPGPSTSLLREVDLHHFHPVNVVHEHGVAVYADQKSRRLVIGFIQPMEWVVSTNIITLDYTRCKKGSVQLVLPWDKRP